MDIFLPLIIAALSGVAMAVQGTLNSYISKLSGNWKQPSWFILSDY